MAFPRSKCSQPFPCSLRYDSLIADKKNHRISHEPIFQTPLSAVYVDNGSQTPMNVTHTIPYDCYSAIARGKGGPAQAACSL